MKGGEEGPGTQVIFEFPKKKNNNNKFQGRHRNRGAKVIIIIIFPPPFPRFCFAELAKVVVSYPNGGLTSQIANRLKYPLVVFSLQSAPQKAKEDIYALP